MMSIRMLYGLRFRCARMGGGYSPLMMYRDPMGSNNAYFRSHSALQFRGQGDGQTSGKVLYEWRKNISPHFPHFSSFLPISLLEQPLGDSSPFLFIPFIYLKISKEIDFCGALG